MLTYRRDFVLDRCDHRMHRYECATLRQCQVHCDTECHNQVLRNLRALEAVPFDGNTQYWSANTQYWSANTQYWSANDTHKHHATHHKY